MLENGKQQKWSLYEKVYRQCSSWNLKNGYLQRVLKRVFGPKKGEVTSTMDKSA
jgi:hypothetical protein